MDEWQKIDCLMSFSRELVKSMVQVGVDLQHVLACFECLVLNLHDSEVLCSQATGSHSTRDVRAGVRDIRRTVSEFREMYERLERLLDKE